jgi:predicted ribosomally synthesized peptide with nif11-like leader
LREKLKAAQDNDAVVAIAQEAGLALSSTQVDQLATELSDEELENITGDHTTPTIRSEGSI